MTRLRPVEITVPWLPGNIDAVTLWPFIVYRKGHETEMPLRLHEFYHWRQALQFGVVPWYLAYLILEPAYFWRPRKHPLEAPAYFLQRTVWDFRLGGQDITPFLDQEFQEWL